MGWREYAAEAPVAADGSSDRNTAMKAMRASFMLLAVVVRERICSLLRSAIRGCILLGSDERLRVIQLWSNDSAT